MRKIRQTEQKEIGRIKLSNTRGLVASIIDAEKLDLRIWVDSNSYKEWTKQGLRFYLFDGNWEGFKELMGKVNKEYENLV